MKYGVLFSLFMSGCFSLEQKNNIESYGIRWESGLGVDQYTIFSNSGEYFLRKEHGGDTPEIYPDVVKLNRSDWLKALKIIEREKFWSESNTGNNGELPSSLEVKMTGRKNMQQKTVHYLGGLYSDPINDLMSFFEELWIKETGK
jgi:hypothetical protein